MTDAPTKFPFPNTLKRSKQGYQRDNGRWEARYRPQSRIELLPDEQTLAAFKGYANGVYKYEFLEYFDTKEEKDEWLSSMKHSFSSRKSEAVMKRSQNEGPKASQGNELGYNKPSQINGDIYNVGLDSSIMKKKRPKMASSTSLNNRAVAERRSKGSKSLSPQPQRLAPQTGQAILRPQMMQFEQSTCDESKPPMIDQHLVEHGVTLLQHMHSFDDQSKKRKLKDPVSLVAARKQEEEALHQKINEQEHILLAKNSLKRPVPVNNSCNNPTSKVLKMSEIDNGNSSQQSKFFLPVNSNESLISVNSIPTRVVWFCTNCNSCSDQPDKFNDDANLETSGMRTIVIDSLPCPPSDSGKDRVLDGIRKFMKERNKVATKTSPPSFLPQITTTTATPSSPPQLTGTVATPSSPPQLTATAATPSSPPQLTDTVATPSSPPQLTGTAATPSSPPQITSTTAILPSPPQLTATIATPSSPPATSSSQLTADIVRHSQLTSSTVSGSIRCTDVAIVTSTTSCVATTI